MKIRSSQDILNMCHAMCTTQQTTNSVNKPNPPKPIENKKANTKPETKVGSPKPTMHKIDIETWIIAIRGFIENFAETHNPDILSQICKGLSTVIENDTADDIKHLAIAVLNNINASVAIPKFRDNLANRLLAMYAQIAHYPNNIMQIIDDIEKETAAIKASVEVPTIGKGLNFNIRNFVKCPDPISTKQPMTKVDAVKQTAERKVYDPRPGKSLEDKVKELKTHISFGPSEGKDITEDGINAMINFFIDGKGFKKQMKKMGCKANLNTIHMTEVPHDKYEGVDDKFDMVFEVPTNKASNPIVVMYRSTPEWSEQISSFVSLREIKMASEMKLSKKKDKKSEAPEKKLETSKQEAKKSSVA